LEKCTRVLISLSKAIPEDLVVHHYGGFDVLGGFTTLNTGELIEPAVGDFLLKEYQKLVPADESKTQQSYSLSPGAQIKGPVAKFMVAHKDLTLATLNATGENWSWSISSLLLVSQKLQDGFHDHLTPTERADSNNKVRRQNAGVSLRHPGTVFRSPTDEQDIYHSKPGESTIFNEGALHQSPDGAYLRLYLLHWFSRIDQ
jgi:hypothetical protein